MSRVLVTGASGFIGRALLPMLRGAGHDVVAARRGEAAGYGDLRLDLAAQVPVDTAHLESFDVIVHLGGLAHVGPGREAEARTVNAIGSRRLAAAAAAAGVTRFVFVSTAQVHGRTDGGRPVTRHAPLHPADAYAASKAEAETALREVADAGTMALTIVRPPMVYGAGAKGNVARLVAWARRGWPLPSGVNANIRSFVACGNLCDLLVRLVPPRQPHTEAFLVRDREDVSTGTFYRELCAALGVRPRFLPLSRAAASLLLRSASRTRFAESLLGDFRLDDTPTRRELAWEPPLDLRAGIAALVRESS